MTTRVIGLLVVWGLTLGVGAAGAYDSLVEKTCSPGFLGQRQEPAAVKLVRRPIADLKQLRDLLAA